MTTQFPQTPRSTRHHTKRVRLRKSFFDRLATFAYLLISTAGSFCIEEYRYMKKVLSKLGSTFGASKNKSRKYHKRELAQESGAEAQSNIARPRDGNFLDLREKQMVAPEHEEDHEEPEPEKQPQTNNSLVPVVLYMGQVFVSTKKELARITNGAAILLARQGVVSVKKITRARNTIQQAYPFLFVNRTLWGSRKITHRVDRVMGRSGALIRPAIQWILRIIPRHFGAQVTNSNSFMATVKKKITKHTPKRLQSSSTATWIYRIFLSGLIVGFVVLGFFFIWVATLEIPNSNIDDIITAQSTKIYDSTGEVLLYDVFEDERRTSVSLVNISEYMRKAILATEDDEFYNHSGYDISAISRSVCYEFSRRLGLGTLGGLCPKGGGSTITQQVIKNTLLNDEYSYARKIKEVILARRLEKQKTKDEILEIYLNEIAFGGPVYGVQQASLSIFDKPASDLTIRESAYLAALPKAPSTYRNDEAKWTGRADYILGRMLELGYISQTDYTEAKNEAVVFAERVDKGIKAPHFVFYVQEQLEEKLLREEEEVSLSGVHIRTTLNWKLQQEIERIASSSAVRLAGYNASNLAIVAVENKTGKIIALTGSKDYFAEDIDGKFNVANASRQPGSTFKPFVYANAFALGYNPDTILWDTKTEFSTSCYPDGTPKAPSDESKCYNPVNYDYKTRGPLTMRSALAQSLNIPAVKTLYLTGVASSMQFAKDMGITTLNRAPGFYGLNLVLGGGEVKLVDMVAAYSVFANDGVRHERALWEDITDAKGNLIDEYEDTVTEVIPKNVAAMINSVLSDNNAKRPMFGQNSRLYYETTPVAVKTGTTNNYRDMWTVGYTPEVTVGVWVGNNENTPMASQPSSTVVGPIWREAMDEALKLYPPTSFSGYTVPDKENLKPILRGEYKGGSLTYVDQATGEVVDNPTEEEIEAGLYVPTGSVEYHSILHYVSRGENPQTSTGGSDGLYENFEYGVQNWVEAQGWQKEYATSTIQDLIDQIQVEQDQDNGSSSQQNTSQTKTPVDFAIVSPISGEQVDGDKRFTIQVDIIGDYSDIDTFYYYLNNTYLGAGSGRTTSINVTPNNTRGSQDQNEVRVIAETKDGRRIEHTAILNVR